MLFTLAALAGGSAYIFYLVYVVKQPLGKGHGQKAAEGQEVKKDLKDSRLIEERKARQMNENRDIEKLRSISGNKDSNKSDSQIPDRRNNPIDADQVKLQIQEQVNKNVNNPKASEAAANFLNKEVIDKASRDVSSSSQSQYMQRPQPATNNPVGSAARQMDIARFTQNKIEEDDEGEYEEEEEEDEVDPRKQQMSQQQILQQRAAQQQRLLQQQQLGAQQQLAAHQQRPAQDQTGSTMQLRGRPN